MGTSNVLNRRLVADSTGDNKAIFGGSLETPLGQNLKTFVMSHRVDFSDTQVQRLVIPLTAKLLFVYAVCDTAQGGGETSTVDIDTQQGPIAVFSFNNVAAGASSNLQVVDNEQVFPAGIITMTKSSIGAANTFITFTYIFSID